MNKPTKLIVKSRATRGWRRILATSSLRPHKSACLELFASKPSNALYHLLNRGGVSIVALRTADLSREQLIKILTYRLAQYVAVNFVEHQMVYKARMEHDPLSDVSSDDVRICLAPFLQCWLLLLRPLLLPRFPRQPEERNRRSSSRSVVVCHKPVK